MIEGGFASSLSSWLDNNIDPGLYYIQCNLKTNQLPEKAEPILSKELNRLKTEEVSYTELQRAKNRLKADFIKSHDSVTQQAQYLAWYEAIGSYSFIEDYIKNIDKVTPADVKKVASAYFSDNTRVIGKLYPSGSPAVAVPTPTPTPTPTPVVTTPTPAASPTPVANPSPEPTPGVREFKPIPVSTPTDNNDSGKKNTVKKGTQKPQKGSKPYGERKAGDGYSFLNNCGLISYTKNASKPCFQTASFTRIPATSKLCSALESANVLVATNPPPENKKYFISKKKSSTQNASTTKAKPKKTVSKSASSKKTAKKTSSKAKSKTVAKKPVKKSSKSAPPKKYATKSSSKKKTSGKSYTAKKSTASSSKSKYRASSKTAKVAPAKYRKRLKPSTPVYTKSKSAPAKVVKKSTPVPQKGAVYSLNQITPPRPVSLKIRRVALSNGVVLLIHENPMNPSVSIKGYIKAGGMYENPRKAGIARMTALLLQLEAEKAGTSGAGENTDSLGTEINFTSTLQQAEFGVWSLSENLDKVIPIISGAITKAAFTDEDVDNVRNKMLSRFISEDSNPSSVVLRDFYLKVFPEKHPFHHFRWGSKETLQGITRMDVLEYYRSHYRPESTIIAVSGDVKAAKVQEIFEKEMSSWKAEGDLPQLVISEVNLPSATDELVNSMMDQSKVEIIMGHKGIPRTHPDFHKFNMMNYILGGAPVISRLCKNVQDKGLAYSISSRLDTSVGDGPWYVKMSLGSSDVTRAISSVKNEIINLQKKPPSQEEVNIAKNALIGSLPVQLQTNDNIASMLLTMEYYKLGEDYPITYYNAYKSITPKDIQDVARKYLYPDKMTVIVAGPYK
jgi:predicted Zn-dependent peptidase